MCTKFMLKIWRVHNAFLFQTSQWHCTLHVLHKIVASSTKMHPRKTEKTMNPFRKSAFIEFSSSFSSFLWMWKKILSLNIAGLCVGSRQMQLQLHVELYAFYTFVFSSSLIMKAQGLFSFRNAMFYSINA